MKIKYAVIRLANMCCLLHRFEDEEDEIVLGTLPTQFQALLFGPSDWQVIRIFPADVTDTLEALVLLQGEERAVKFACTIFEAGREAARLERT